MNRPSTPILTANLDYTDGQRGIDNLLHVLPGAALAMVQEAKYIDLRDDLSTLVGVHQNTTTRAKAGVGIIWDKSQIEVTDRGLTIGTRPRGRKMLARHLAWVDAHILDPDLRVTAIAAHRPPRRFDQLWTGFDRNLEELIAEAAHPVVVGIDSNDPHARAMAKRMGLKWAGVGIDGFAYDPTLIVDYVHALHATKSDHRAVVGNLRSRW